MRRELSGELRSCKRRSLFSAVVVAAAVLLLLLLLLKIIIVSRVLVKLAVRLALRIRVAPVALAVPVVPLSENAAEQPRKTPIGAKAPKRIFRMRSAPKS